MPRPKVGWRRPSGNGGTSDLSIDVPAGATIEDIVAFVIDRAAKGEVDVVHETHVHFGLSQEDGFLAVDRTFDGIARAVSPDPRNQPDSRLDPVAAASYRMVRDDPSIAAAISPNLPEWIYLAKQHPDVGPLDEDVRIELLVGVIEIVVVIVLFVVVLGAR